MSWTDPCSICGNHKADCECGKYSALIGTPNKLPEIKKETMTKQQVGYAERKAMQVFDMWNDVTGAIQVNSGWYSEIESVIEDAVHIGIQMAMHGKIHYNIDGEIIKST